MKAGLIILLLFIPFHSVLPSSIYQIILGTAYLMILIDTIHAFFFGRMKGSAQRILIFSLIFFSVSQFYGYFFLNLQDSQMHTSFIQFFILFISGLVNFELGERAIRICLLIGKFHLFVVMLSVVSTLIGAPILGEQTRFFGLIGDQSGWFFTFFFTYFLKINRPFWAGLFMAGILVSGTLGAIALAGVLFVLEKGVFSRYILYVSLAILILAIGGGLVFIDRFSSGAYISSLNHRLESFYIAMNFIRESWFLGHGFGTYSLNAIKSFGSGIFIEGVEKLSTTVFASSQNQILETLYNFGFIGFLMVIRYFRYIFFNYSKVMRLWLIVVLLFQQSAIYLLPGSLVFVLLIFGKGFEKKTNLYSK